MFNKLWLMRVTDVRFTARDPEGRAACELLSMGIWRKVRTVFFIPYRLKKRAAGRRNTRN